MFAPICDARQSPYRRHLGVPALIGQRTNATRHDRCCTSANPASKHAFRRHAHDLFRKTLIFGQYLPPTIRYRSNRGIRSVVDHDICIVGVGGANMSQHGPLILQIFAITLAVFCSAVFPPVPACFRVPNTSTTSQKVNRSFRERENVFRAHCASGTRL